MVRRVRVWWIALALLAVGLLAEPPARAQQPDRPPSALAGRITALRFGGDEKTTRVVIDSDAELSYQVFALAAGSSRLVLDMPRVRWSLEGLTAESGAGQGKGLVSGYRYAQNTVASSRLVLDLSGPAVVTRSFAIAPKEKGEPHRIVMDIERVTAAQFAERAAAEHPGVHAPSAKPARKPLIVIDAGHGGKDPGAMSATGTREKDVTLAAALALRNELQKAGRFDVALTRATDEFIELEDRVTRARDLGADLFISLHADAGSKSETSGASVYTLSPEGEKRAETLRQKNDWVLAVETDASRSKEVNQILADLVQRETKNQSARFAQMLAPALADAGWPALQNTIRKRGFFVLLSPDVPAVLLEMGFITNPGDASMLTSDKHRRKLAKGIVAAIDQFFDTEAKVLASR